MIEKIEFEEKEMVYNEDRLNKLISKGETKGFKWYIVNRGHFPCCYIDISSIPREVKDIKVTHNEWYTETEFKDLIPCHGDVTYNSGGLTTDQGEFSGDIIGWDYAHAGDYIYPVNEEFNLEPEAFKYSLKQLKQDVQEVIGFLYYMRIITTSKF